jgi:hypothetical protein
MIALYLTIWLALVLFVAGETGRSLTPRGAAPPAWAWWTFTLGLTLAIVHTLLAFEFVHGWIHADAVRDTATQTNEMFGIAAGWGVYVNYLFFAVWLADAVWWRITPPGHVRPRPLVWGLRAFYLIIIVNAAVVFAAGLRRLLGILIVSWLTRVWSVRSSSSTRF